MRAPRTPVQTGRPWSRSISNPATGSVPGCRRCRVRSCFPLLRLQNIAVSTARQFADGYGIVNSRRIGSGSSFAFESPTLTPFSGGNGFRPSNDVL